MWAPTSNTTTGQPEYALHEAIVVPGAGPGPETDLPTYREASRPLQDPRIAFLLRVKPELARRIHPL